MKMEFLEDSITIDSVTLDQYFSEGDDITKVHKIKQIYDEREVYVNNIQNLITKVNEELDKCRDLKTGYQHLSILTKNYEEKISNNKKEFFKSNRNAILVILFIIGLLFELKIEGDEPFGIIVISSLVLMCILFVICHFFAYLSIPIRVKLKQKDFKKKAYLKSKLDREINQYHNDKSKGYLPEIEMLQNKITRLDVYLKKYSILSEKFNNYHAYKIISEYFIDRRADTLKEAINLYVFEYKK